MALAVRLGADHDADCPVLHEQDPGHLLRIAHGRFDVVGHAAATAQATPLGCGLAAGEAGPAAGFERGVHDLGEVAGIVALAGRGLERHGSRGDEVAPPELGRILAQLARGLVHQPLHQVDRLGPAGAAIGIHGRGVGQHALDPVDQVLDVIDPGQDLERRASRDERREQVDVGAHVGPGHDLHADDLVVGIEAELGDRDVVAAHHIRQEAVARALGGPFDRPLELARRPGGHGIFRIDHRLHAEAAADIRRQHPDLLPGHAHEAGYRVDPQMAALGAGMQGQGVAAGIVLGDAGARLHGIGDQAVVDQLQRGHMRRPGQRLLGRRPLAELPVEGQVGRHVVVDQGLARLLGLLGVRRDRQAVVIDLDQLGGVLGGAQALGHDEGDMVADMADPVGAQHHPERQLRGAAVAVLHRDQARQGVAAATGHDVLAGDHRQHAGRGLGGADVDRCDAGMRLG